MAMFRQLTEQPVGCAIIPPGFREIEPMRREEVRRTLRIATLLLLVALGMRVRIPTATCSAELIPEFVPVPFRLLPGEKVLLGHDLQPKADAMHLLMRIRATRGG